MWDSFYYGDVHANRLGRNVGQSKRSTIGYVCCIKLPFVHVYSGSIYLHHIEDQYGKPSINEMPTLSHYFCDFLVYIFRHWYSLERRNVATRKSFWEQTQTGYNTSKLDGVGKTCSYTFVVLDFGLRLLFSLRASCNGSPTTS